MSRIFTVEFIVSSIITAFIINLLSSVVFSKLSKDSYGFRYRKLTNFKEEFSLVTRLHSDNIQLQCFAFKGIGMTLAMLLISSGAFMIPMAISLSVEQAQEEHPTLKLNSEDCKTPAQNASSLALEKYERNKQECEEYRRKSSLYHEHVEFVEKLKKWSFLVGLWLGLIFGAISLYFAWRVYRYFGLVQHYKEYNVNMNNLLSLTKITEETQAGKSDSANQRQDSSAA